MAWNFSHENVGYLMIKTKTIRDISRTHITKFIQIWPTWFGGRSDSTSLELAGCYGRSVRWDVSSGVKSGGTMGTWEILKSRGSGQVGSWRAAVNGIWDEFVFQILFGRSLKAFDSGKCSEAFKQLPNPIEDLQRPTLSMMKCGTEIPGQM